MNTIANLMSNEIARRLLLSAILYALFSVREVQTLLQHTLPVVKDRDGNDITGEWSALLWKVCGYPILFQFFASYDKLLMEMFH